MPEDSTWTTHSGPIHSLAFEFPRLVTALVDRKTSLVDVGKPFCKLASLPYGRMFPRLGTRTTKVLSPSPISDIVRVLTRLFFYLMQIVLILSRLVGWCLFLVFYR